MTICLSSLADQNFKKATKLELLAWPRTEKSQLALTALKSPYPLVKPKKNSNTYRKSRKSHHRIIKSARQQNPIHPETSV